MYVESAARGADRARRPDRRFTENFSKKKVQISIFLFLYGMDGLVGSGPWARNCARKYSRICAFISRPRDPANYRDGTTFLKP
jgi:hypothetical protein